MVKRKISKPAATKKNNKKFGRRNL